MKCSHGLPYEVKCRLCFDEAMKRVSASQPLTRSLVDHPEVRDDVFLLGTIQRGVDKNPRPL